MSDESKFKAATAGHGKGSAMASGTTKYDISATTSGFMRISGLYAGYDGTDVIRDLSITFSSRITCLMGESGCGKTTLLKVLIGLVPVRAGEIINPPRYPIMMFQEDRLIPGLNVLKNVELVAYADSVPSPAKKYLEALDMAQSSDKFPSELSGGMSRRVALARALTAISPDCDMLVLDEPFKGLDRDLVLKAAALIRDVPVPVIVTTHDPGDAELLGAKTVRLNA